MKKGYYGVYGGRFIPEILYRALIELEKNFKLYRNDIAFNREYKYYLTNYIGRPTPLYYAERLSAHFGNSNKIFFKREDLCHTGSHKLNNALKQALLALKLGKTRLIAETGAGQHGVATATVAALFGLKCSVYMGKVDIERQAMNVARMKLLGAEVAAVDTGNMTLKDAVNEALKDWVSSYKNTHYVIGSVIGPYPYPEMVAHFQKVIGSETYNQFKKLKLKKKYPDTLIACVGAGSNAIGLFKYFIDKKVNCKYIGVEAAGMGLTSGEHSAKLLKGEPGVLHGTYTYILQDSSGQIIEPYSISAGLDYPGVGPIHSYLKDEKIVEYKAVTDREALDAVDKLTKYEGILPALESAHAVAYCLKYVKKTKNENIVVCLSGRGDKDMQTICDRKEKNNNA